MENRREDVGRSVRLALGGGHVVLGIGLFIALVAAIPARYLPVDLSLGLVALLLVAGGGALLGGVRQGLLLARIASAVTLAVGLGSVTALLWTAAYLKGIYGALGQGASMMFTLIVFTVLPYLVIYPGVALALLRPAAGAAEAKAEAKPAAAEETKAAKPEAKAAEEKKG